MLDESCSSEYREYLRLWVATFDRDEDSILLDGDGYYINLETDNGNPDEHGYDVYIKKVFAPPEDEAVIFLRKRNRLIARHDNNIYEYYKRKYEESGNSKTILASLVQKGFDVDYILGYDDGESLPNNNDYHE